MSDELKESKNPSSVSRHFSLVLLHVICYSLLVTVCSAEVIDRVVAYVDDTAITLSEFQKTYATTKETVGSVSEEDVINSMINSLLLLKEARSMRLDAPTKDDMLKDYIDIKIKSAIIIREDEMESFYIKNIGNFKGKDYVSVRDEIEKYLFEAETNKRLKKHLEELRSNAEIKIQLTAD